MPSSFCMATYDARGENPPSGSDVYAAASSLSAGPEGPPVEIQVCGGYSELLTETAS